MTDIFIARKNVFWEINVASKTSLYFWNKFAMLA